MCLSCMPLGRGTASIDICHCGSPKTQAAISRLEADISRRQMLGGTAAVLGMFAGFGLAPKQVRAQTPGRPLLLTNLRLFDGETLSMRDGVDILIEGERIAALPPAGQGPQDAQRIDCGGRAVVPGLIDAHWHATLVAVSQIAALTQDVGFIHLMAGREAGATLMRGFTTVRDLGGPAFGLKLAIDKGAVTGPRIFPSGAMISQTAGHGDFRLLSELPRFPDTPPNNIERQGVALIADGADAVLRATREQLMKGASQIKIMAGGGVSSLYDPLDTVQYTEAEMRAAVEAAADWGTYVCAHVYTPGGIRRAVRAGVKSIEHGQLADEEAVRIMADAGAWWSIQPFLADEDSNPKPDPIQQAKQMQVAEGTVRAFELARKHDVSIAFGTDILFNPAGAASQGRQLAKFARFMSPLEALHKATGAAGELLALSGERAPYAGRLGVIAEGALADLLVIDGDPETDLAWLDTPDTSLRLIMKGGRVFKETL
ncbi:amidohydrolase family protein [Paracoccus pantotrophus]|uniref:Amidohydrolase family protein n=2 Tax=Paracoccaceae TaxID=31989 RepID=A0A7H9BW10_PARPN|nr:amidohydrolase family protein [Paracoccus pantotrophus]QLH14966.1 amidohydrolase family protein [Paracoccus pantotrophus]RNI15563.1 amidohydrolase family protein [Paracoccus pantotrophus]